LFRHTTKEDGMMANKNKLKALRNLSFVVDGSRVTVVKGESFTCPDDKVLWFLNRGAAERPASKKKKDSQDADTSNS